MENALSTTLITGHRTRLSYAQLFEPKAFEDGKPMYSVSLIIPKGDRRTINRIDDAVRAAYKAGTNKLRGNSDYTPSLDEINLPLNDGDNQRPNDPAYDNCYYINAKNQNPPKLFDEDGKEVTDRRVIYSGCYARCKIQFYCYNKEGNKGIGAIILGLRKTADGTPLGGGGCCTAEDFENDEDYGDDFLS